MSAISSFLGSVMQSNAASDAASAQQQSANQATQLQYDLGMAGLNQQQQMYDQAMANYAPYMAAGTQGLSWLTGANYTAPSTSSSGASASAAPESGAYINGQWVPESQMTQSQLSPTITQQQWVQDPNFQWVDAASNYGPNAGMIMQDVEVANPNYVELTTRPTSTAQIEPGTQYIGQPTSTTQVEQGTQYINQPGAIGQINTQLSPYAQAIYNYQTPTLPGTSIEAPIAEAPTLATGLDYSFNTEDPVYQQKLIEKNAEIDKFLAKQGLAGSSAGEAFRQKQLDSLKAADEERQYQRAVAARDYSTQAAISQYGLNSDYANTVYSRGVDQYGRDLSSTLTADELARARLATNLDVASNLYGLQYGAALDLANLGYGSASNAGQSAIQTGSGMSGAYSNLGSGLASTALYSGNAAAQGSLASGQAYSAALQNIGNTAANVASMFYQPSSYSNYGNYGGYGYGGWGSGYGSSSFYGSDSYGGGGYSPDTYMG